MATEAASGRNGALAGGPGTSRRFLAAGLVDEQPMVIAPVLVDTRVAPLPLGTLPNPTARRRSRCGGRVVVATRRPWAARLRPPGLRQRAGYVANRFRRRGHRTGPRLSVRGPGLFA